MIPLRSLLALVLPFLAQDAAKKPGDPCDVATVQDAFWCGKCGKVRDPEQLAEGKCKDCRTAAEPVKVCVKDWIPRCGMHNQEPHLKDCCRSKFCCKHEILKSPLVFRCAGCGASARAEADLKHDGKEHDKKLLKSCEASGTRPHGGEPIK